MAEVKITDDLALMAQRFGIDLASLADGLLRERILSGPTQDLTPRMQRALLRAQEEARKHHQSHIGTEHVVLGIVLDPDSIPSQVLKELGVADELIRQLQTLLSSDGYNRRPS